MYHLHTATRALSTQPFGLSNAYLSMYLSQKSWGTPCGIFLWRRSVVPDRLVSVCAAGMCEAHGFSFTTPAGRDYTPRPPQSEEHLSRFLQSGGFRHIREDGARLSARTDKQTRTLHDKNTGLLKKALRNVPVGRYQYLTADSKADMSVLTVRGVEWYLDWNNVSLDTYKEEILCRI